LIGESGKISKAALKASAGAGAVEVKHQIYAYILIIIILVVFAASFGGLMIIRKMTSNLDKNIIKLDKELKLLKEQENTATEFKKNLQKEKETAEFKILIQKQINNNFIIWSNVLKEIGDKIPKNIIIQKIEKEGSTKKSKTEAESVKLKISGLTSANKTLKPFMSISLFIFNLNDSENSFFSDTKISKLEFNEKAKTYEFEIETSMKKPKNQKILK